LLLSLALSSRFIGTMDYIHAINIFCICSGDEAGFTDGVHTGIYLVLRQAFESPIACAHGHHICPGKHDEGPKAP